MVMKNVKNVNYLQIDHKIKEVLEEKGVEVLSSPEAWKKYEWSRKFFQKKPKEGYFIWVKNQINFPIATCVQTSSEKISQDMNNLVVVEKNIHAKALSLCSSLKKNLFSLHKAEGKIVIKENSALELNSIHRWDRSDNVDIDYKYFLGKNSNLSYTFKTLSPSGKFSSKTETELSDYSKAELKIIINGINSKIKTEDGMILNGKKASGVLRLRTVARKNSQIEGVTKAIGNEEGKAHLDCQGLLVDNTSFISLIPRLLVKNKRSILTHEASIGRIADEQLNYLRSRGLTEKEAIDLIVNGFLNE